MKQRLLLTLLVLSLTVVAKAQGNTAPAVKDGISYHINYDKKTAKVIAPINFNGEKKEYIGNIVIPETIRFTAEDATVLSEDMTHYVQFGTDYKVTEISTEAFKNDVTTGVEIPGTVDEIPDFCFTYCPNLRNVIIHYGVQRVGKYAFCGAQKIGETTWIRGLKNLESVIFNSTVTFLTNGKGNCVIDDCAFSGCENLKNLELRCVTSIGVGAFHSNSLTQLTLPESLNTIRKGAFKETKIKSLRIPSSLTIIEEEAFAFTDLMSIEVDARNTKYDSRENCNAIIETANNSLILGCGNTIIPNSVTSLGYCAFFGCLGLTSITIPNSVTSIENAAFFGCWNLESVNIPNTITIIGDNTFEGCMRLPAINIPSSITNIGMFAFNDCRSLTNVDIPESVTSIGRRAFQRCINLKSINIGNGVTYIGGSAFRECEKLTDVTIGNSVVCIDSCAFYNCRGLKCINIPNSVTNIRAWAFDCCSSLTSITLPESVSNIESEAFKLCISLDTVTVMRSDPAAYNCSSDAFAETPISSATLKVPSGCRDVYAACEPWCNFKNVVEDTRMFNESYGGLYYKFNKYYMTVSVTNDVNKYTGNITIPSTVTYDGDTYSVTSIENNTFEDCMNIKSITIPYTINKIGNNAFNGCTGLKTVTLNSNAITSDTYTSSSNISAIFGTQVSEYILGDSITSIGDYAFYQCTNLKKLTIGKSVKSIGESAFTYCTNLTSVTIPVSVTTIEDMAFAGTGLTSIMLPRSVTSIGNSSFAACTSLTKVTIPNTVTSIGECAFYRDTKLTSVTIPNSVTSIEEGTFAGCTSLTNVTIPNSVTSIGDLAFEYCSSLASVIIPESVTTIGEEAFAMCTSLTNVTIPNSVTSIGEFAFVLTGLTSIKVDAGNSVYDSRDNCNAIVETSSNSLIVGCKNSTIPNSVTSVGDYAFYYCGGLTSITIPNSVTSIGKYAFNECTNLKEIYCLNETPPTLGNDALPDGLQTTSATPSLKEENGCIVYVPIGCRETYSEAWNIPTSRIVEIEVTAIEKTPTTSTEAHPTGYYNLQGQRINKPQSGIVIVRYSDGTNRKMLVK